MADTVFAELLEVLGLEEKEGEAALAFAERLALKANTLKDDEWATLSESGQLWVNTALKAFEEKSDIPLPAGMVQEKAGEGVAQEAEGTIVMASMTKKKAVARSGAKKKKVVATSAKPTKAAKPAKKAGANGERPGPKGLFQLADKIKLIAASNPYRFGTKGAVGYSKYKNNMKAADALALGVTRRQIRYDTRKGYIQVGP